MLNRVLLAAFVALVPSLAFGQANWNDYATGATISRLVNTVGSDGVAETITSEDVLVVKDGATVLTAGITIDDDVSLDFGGGAATKAGLHKITIVLTTSGYDDGDYEVIYKAGDVDAVTVARRVLATFSIGRNADVSEIWDELSDEPTSPPGATASRGEKIDWLFLIARNRKTVTDALIQYFADDGSTVVGEADLSPSDDDTVDQGEATAP